MAAFLLPEILLAQIQRTLRIPGRDGGGVRGRWHSGVATELKSTGMRWHSDEVSLASKTPRAVQPRQPQLQSWGRGRQTLWCACGHRVPGSPGSAYGDRQLSVSPSRWGLSKKALSSLIKCWLCLTSPAPTWRHTVFTTTEAHTPHVVCGQQTNNSLNQTHDRKLETLPASKHMFVVPTNHLSVQQTDARGRKSGPTALIHRNTHHAAYSPARLLQQPCSQASREKQECCIQRETLSRMAGPEGISLVCSQEDTAEF